MTWKNLFSSEKREKSQENALLLLEVFNFEAIYTAAKLQTSQNGESREELQKTLHCSSKFGNKSTYTKANKAYFWIFFGRLPTYLPCYAEPSLGAND